MRELAIFLKLCFFRVYSVGILMILNQAGNRTKCQFGKVCSIYLLFLCCKTQKVDLYAGHRESGRREHSKEPAFKRMKELGSLSVSRRGSGKAVVLTALAGVRCPRCPVAPARLAGFRWDGLRPSRGPALLECLFALIGTLCSSWLTTLIAKQFLYVLSLCSE